VSQAPAAIDRVEALLGARLAAGERFFADHAQKLSRVCHAMAERFSRGGRLLALASAPAQRSDARHVAVEFVHPVIVGKRALPALALTAEGGSLEGEVALLAHGQDILIGFGEGEEVAVAIRRGRAAGCLTVGFAHGCGAEHVFEPPTEDPFICQELVETLYHVLWELVHVFFEHRGLLEGRIERRSHDAGASAFLYPFLDERESRLEPVLDDVRASVAMKAAEIGQLRASTLREGACELIGAAERARASFAAGGKLLACGNGGSATDAMDAVADLRSPPPGLGLTPRPAIDLSEDPSILTAIANDIGVEAIFMRQVIAYGNRGDVLLTLSTSGNSANVIAALREARSRGLESVALVGYDGGRIAAEGLADHVIVSRCEHIPRIQEAQASAYHVLRELVG
jgi:D-sedoheptulose 7-phosphate isomerase